MLSGCSLSRVICWPRMCQPASTRWRFVFTGRLYRILCTSSSTLSPQRASPSPTRKTQVGHDVIQLHTHVLCTRCMFKVFVLAGLNGLGKVFLKCHVSGGTGHRPKGFRFPATCPSQCQVDAKSDL